MPLFDKHLKPPLPDSMWDRYLSLGELFSPEKRDAFCTLCESGWLTIFCSQKSLSSLELWLVGPTKSGRLMAYLLDRDRPGLFYFFTILQLFAFPIIWR